MRASQLILRDDAPLWTIPPDGKVHITGTNGEDKIALSAGSQVSFSTNFNKGNDRIYIQDNAADYSVSRSGTTITLTAADGGVITIPAGPNAQQLVFGDGAAHLKIDGGAVKIGGQVITAANTPIDISAAGANLDPAATSWEQFGGTPPVPAVPQVSVSGPGSVTEGETAVYTVTLNKAGESDLTVGYTLTFEGGAEEADLGDGSRLEGEVTIRKNTIRAKVEVPVAEDSDRETGEAVRLTITAPEGFDAGIDSVRTELRDLEPLAFALSPANSGGFLEGQPLEFLITANRPLREGEGMDFECYLTPGNGSTETNGEDFRITSPNGLAYQKVSFAAGESSVSFTFEQTETIEDGPEPPEQFTVTAYGSNSSFQETCHADVMGAGTSAALSAEQEEMSGTLENDIYLALPGSLNAGDSLDGKGGIDTLKLYDTPSMLSNIEMSNIEIVKNFTENQTLDISFLQSRGVEQIWLMRDIHPDSIDLSGLHLYGDTPPADIPDVLKLKTARDGGLVWIQGSGANTAFTIVAGKEAALFGPAGENQSRAAICVQEREALVFIDADTNGEWNPSEDLLVGLVGDYTDMTWDDFFVFASS